MFPKKNDEKGGDKVKFTKIARQRPLPFYIVADFECILEKTDTCLPAETKSSTTILNKHVPCGAAYKISCTDPRFYRDPVIITPDNSGKNVAERFLDAILEDAKDIREMLSYKAPMLPLTEKEKEAYKLSSSENVICHICEKTIKTDEVKCPDHCHLTGQYRGPSHQSCNLNYQIKPEKIQIPCFFHNLKNYDSHLLISAAKKRHGEIKVIPNTVEKYIAFTIGDIVFKDSYAFTQASLDSLAGNLTPDQLVNTRKWLQKSTERRRGITAAVGVDEESPSRQRRRFYIDNDDDGRNNIDKELLTSSSSSSPPFPKRLRSDNNACDDDDDDDNMFITRQRCRRIIKSSHQEEQEQKTAAAAAASSSIIVDFPDDDDDGDDDGEDDINNYEGDEEVAYLMEMAQFDYRHAPHNIQPSLLEPEEVDEDVNLLSRKGIYPYEYMDSFARFKKLSIPPIEAFQSSLSGGKGISEKEHAHAKKVFEHFEMKTLQDYHNLYLLQDIFLLDDILTAFRQVCLKTYKLDPLHYYTAPGLTWDAGLKYTGVTLDLLTEKDKFLFVEDGIRGGISVISHRHAKANHPDLKNVVVNDDDDDDDDDGNESYWDPKKPMCNLLYLDANNLYGYAMMQYLPVSDFEWMPQVDTISERWIRKLRPDRETGYILEVDIHTPKSMHAKLSDYPPAPERKPILGHNLSPYQREILKEQYRLETTTMTDEMLEEKVKRYKSTEKLILDLEPKTKYILHYRTLQLYLKLGMKITRVHRVLCFKQKPWLESYIKKNTEMRQKAANDFEKDFYKLMNNAFFGKTMENVRKRRHIDIIATPEKLKKLVAQPTFKSITSFNEEISAVERLKAKVMMNKPIYIGLCVLDLSKWLMYDFYYHTLKEIFPAATEQVRLLFTDTDSLCVSIEGCDDVYMRIRDQQINYENDTVEASTFFDFSGYSSAHPIFEGLHDDTITAIKKSNKKVPGKMKDELDGNILLEFIGLRAKAYAFKKLISYPKTGDDGGEIEGDIIEVKKLKGIQKCVVKMSIHFEHYKSCLFDKVTHFATTTSLRSCMHQLKTLRVRKVAMTPYDDKRYLSDDGITSLPYGHRNIYI